MIILGIHDGHNASAALIINGELKCSVAEERLSRQKNHYGFPENAIKCVIEQAGIKFKDIDRVAMSTNKLSPAYFYTGRNSRLSIADYWKEQKDYWYPKIYQNENPNYMDVLSHRVDKKTFPYDETLIKNESDSEGMWNARVKHISKYLQIDETKVSYHNHHKCHAYYAYMMCPKKDDGV